MVDFPTGVPDIPSAVGGNPLSTFHTSESHATSTNRILANLAAVATKLGISSSSPGASAAVLRRTASGQSAWAQLAAGDIAAGAIVNADVNTAAAIAYSKLALANSIVNADINTAAAIALSKLAPGASGVLKSNGSVISAGNQIVSADITDGTIATADLASGAVTNPGYVAVGSGTTVAAGGSLADISGAFVDLTNVAASGQALVVCSAALKNATAGSFVFLALTYDSVAAPTELPTVLPSANAEIIISSAILLTGLAAGTRRVKAQWRVGAGGGTATLFGLQLWAVELRR